MKFAIFGDIHANLEGLEAVLGDAEQQGVQRYVCIGDIVGYNANPHECLQIVKNLECPVVKGNHDEEASLERSLAGFNPLARQALEWTRANLTNEDRNWLFDLRLVRQVLDFTIVHATLDTPNGWAYVHSKFDAMASFNYQFTTLCFYGHTHVPKFYAKDSSVHLLKESRLRVDPNKKYFINVGSVGQPRDGDPRAAYVTYDTDSGEIAIHRVEYDIEKAQQKILAAKLPEQLAARLAIGK